MGGGSEASQRKGHHVTFLPDKHCLFADAEGLSLTHINPPLKPSSYAILIFFFQPFKKVTEIHIIAQLVNIQLQAPLYVTIPGTCLRPDHLTDL
jgi:hypothetical protein